MTLAKRLDEVENRGLGPQEAVLLWMREAHEFGSFERYARWLIDQPDDRYPLIRMPKQVIAAVRARHKGTLDVTLHHELRRVQKEVLFLYYLHSQANTRALMDHEAVQLRVLILVKEIRALISEKHSLDQMRLARIDLDGKKHKRPDKVERTGRTLYEKHLAGWPTERDEVLGRILEFLDAAEILSRRFFAGEDLLFPAVHENLTANLATITNLTDLHQDLGERAPRTDDEFRDYALRLSDESGDAKKGDARSAAIGTVTQGAPGKGRRLAEQWVLMARSETLDDLGEHREAEALSARLVREVL